MANIQDTSSGKTFPEHFPPTAEKISAVSSKPSVRSKTAAFQFLDLRENGQKPERFWQNPIPSHGEFLMHNTGVHEPCRPLCHFVTSPHTVGSHLRTQIVFFRHLHRQNLRQERSVFFAGALCPALLSASLTFPHIVGNHPVLCIKNSPCEGIGFCQNLSGFCPFSRRSRN